MKKNDKSVLKMVKNIASEIKNKKNEKHTVSRWRFYT